MGYNIIIRQAHEPRRVKEVAVEPFVLEAARSVPVAGQYDVVVAGGGVAGIAAALSAKRAGAGRVLLVERAYALGGLATLGLVTVYLPLCDGLGHQVSFGLAEELMRLSVSHGAEKPIPACWQTEMPPEERRTRYECRFNAALFSILCERQLLEEGVEIRYGTQVCGATVAQGRVKALLTESKSGREAFLCESVVDATGDADVCRLAGEETALFRQGNILAAWYYAVEKGELTLHPVGFCDKPDSEKTEADVIRMDGVRRYAGLTAAELSEMTASSHAWTLEHFLSRGEAAPDHMMTALANLPQVRMTRRLDNPHRMCLAAAGRRQADSLGLISNWKRPGPVYEVPLGALCGRLPNLYAAGRNIAAEEDMWDVTRVIPCCAVTGEAAGLAAALGRDVSTLQAALVARGIPLHWER